MLLGLMVASPQFAWAHARTRTFGTLSIEGGKATWVLRIAAADLLAPLQLPEALPPQQAIAELQRRQKDVQSYVSDRLHLSVGERACVAVPDDFAGVHTGDSNTIKLTFAFACPPGPGPYRARYDLFFDMDALASGFTQVELDGADTVVEVFRSESRELTILMNPSASRGWQGFWRLGLQHIFSGYDHLAFLAGLLLLAAVGRRGSLQERLVSASPRRALIDTAKMVSAFTLAHSITLAAAVLRPALVPTRFVEPLIALSVVAVGVQNLLPYVPQLPHLPRQRWPLAFAFGLIHGFGFASALAEFGLPKENLFASLLAFNVGVECGQLCVVLAVLPLLLLVAGKAPRLYQRFFLLGGSAALVAAGLFWLWCRV